MNFDGKKIVVVGTGISGIGAVRLLSHTKARIVLYDGNASLGEKAVRAKLPQGADAEIIIGDMPEHTVKSADLLVISPGVPVDSPIVMQFKAEGVPVWGEIELAYSFEKGTVFAITGTNGKTTTTALVGEIMKRHNPKTFVVGNIGIPYTAKVPETTGDSFTVAEISSFQLETIHDFKPFGAAILNITPDHLDRHYTMENYISVKESITRNQHGDGFCVLNYDDPVLRDFGNTIDNAVYFSSKAKPDYGVYLDGTMIKYTADQTDSDIIDVSELLIFGRHNYENVMAATAMTIAAGVPADTIRNALREFKGVEHRIEFVRELDGVVYYNDSKGTNPDSSIKAVEAMSRPTIIIAGGYDKHSAFDDFIDSFNGKVKLMVLIGETAPLIEETARKHGFCNIIRTDTLENAVKICHDDAADGDAVLLSPACASWDMFTNFEQRGELFKEYVNAFRHN